MTTLTDTDRKVLENGASGRPVDYDWRWDCDGKSVTRSVNKLRKAGLIDVTYFNGYATAHPNPDALH